MADNPLLPQDRLRELRALMLRVRELERRRRRGASARSADCPAREALLAAALLHLGPGDLLSAPADDETSRELAPASPGGSPNHDLPPSLRLPLCAGSARGMQAAATDRLTVAYVSAGAQEPLWEDALSWAYRDQLPLLLLCADVQNAARRTRGGRTQAPITWPTLTRLAQRLRLPVFPVDGQDAVAVYRVMQECTDRARSRGGPSVVWAVLSGAALSRGEQPLARLEAYMAARDIPLA